MGKPKYIETPEALWEHFEAYKGWAKSNPFTVTDWVGGMAKEVVRRKERPLTWVGFEVYLANEGIINDLGDYETNKDGRYPGYATIITRAKKEIELDQFDGASTGLYQQNIIARKLGLVDKGAQENSGEMTIKVKYEKKEPPKDE